MHEYNRKKNFILRTFFQKKKVKIYFVFNARPSLRICPLKSFEFFVLALPLAPLNPPMGEGVFSFRHYYFRHFYLKNFFVFVN